MIALEIFNLSGEEIVLEPDEEEEDDDDDDDDDEEPPTQPWNFPG